MYEVTDAGPYRGELHVVTEVEDLVRLPPPAQKWVSIYQARMFREFPQSLVVLAEGVTSLPYVATWFRALAQAEQVRLEVYLTEYADPQVFVRFMVTSKWTPALGWAPTAKLPSKTPELLRRVYELTGRINFDGYGFAGDLLCPPDKYPSLGSYDEWRGEENPDYDGFMAFYETWTGDKLLVNAEGEVGWWVHDDADACRLIGSLESVLPALFGAFLENRPLKPGEAPA